MSQKWLWAWLGILAAGLVLGTSAGHADVVHLTDGTTKEGKVIEESDDEIVLEMNIRGIKASLHILKKEIESIERETSWRETLDDREKKLEAEDAEGWYKLGMQYKEHGLPDDAKRCFEKVLKANPQHEEAAKELGFVSTGGEFADVEGTIRKGEDLVEAKEYAKAEEKLKPLLDFPVTKVNSVQRKDILGLLITCYERTAQWAKAQDAYEQFLRCATVDKSEVAIIRVKQRVLRENPDGMIDLAEYDAKSKKAQSVLPKLEDFAKIPGAALKAGGDLLTGKGGKSGKGRKGQEEPKYAKGGKQPLSDPKVMDTVIRAEAEGILLEAQHKVEKADAQAVSDKMWQYTPFPIILNLASRPKQVALRSSPAEKLYEEAADVAEDADYLVPGISAALRLKIAQKRAALWDEFIKKTREDMESHPYYMAPPPASATPAQAQQILQQQNQRLSTMNVTMDEAEKYLEIVKRLDALQARKLEVLQPFSDQALA
jgi:tetratricopeptide (TPR) repeat protein